MQSRIGKWFVVAALVVAIGGHWAVLQSVAWVSMFVNFSQTAPVMVALEQTFDGQHPCQLCKVVQEGTETEKTLPIKKDQTKLDFWMISHPAQAVPLQPVFLISSEINNALLRFESPPVPPPRVA